MAIVRFWEGLSFKAKTLALVVVLVSFTVLTGTVYQLLVNKIRNVSIAQTTDTMRDGYKSELKDVVDMMAVTLASSVQGMTDEHQIYRTWKQLVQNARFFPDKSGYIFIYKKGGTVFVLPPEPDLEGKNLINHKDPTGKLLIKELDDVAADGGGYVNYWWPKPHKGLEPKLSYARMMPGGQYWIGAGVYLDNIQVKKETILATINRLTDSFLNILYIGLGAAVLFLALPLTWLLIKSIVTPVRELTVVADQFSLGSLNLDIPYIERKDEIGKLAKALERLGMSIKMAMTRLKR